MKSPVPYFGSKQSIAPWIVSLLPDHGHYVEPFCGSLAVLLAKRPSHAETVNDLSRDLMTFWRVLRDQPANLIRVCALTPHSSAEHEAAFEPAPEGDDLETARRVWIRLTQGRSNALQRRTGWRRQIARDTQPMPERLNASCDRFAAVAERLASVSLECRPALDVIADYGKQPGVLLYVDPPYVASTRNSTHYRHEMTGDAEHRELATALADCKASVVLSGYGSDLYAELFDGWHRYEQSTMTGNATSDKGRTEVLWSNRILAGQVDLFADHEPAA